MRIHGIPAGIHTGSGRRHRAHWVPRLISHGLHPPIIHRNRTTVQMLHGWGRTLQRGRCRQGAHIQTGAGHAAFHLGWDLLRHRAGIGIWRDQVGGCGHSDGALRWHRPHCPICLHRVRWAGIHHRWISWNARHGRRSRHGGNGPSLRPYHRRRISHSRLHLRIKHGGSFPRHIRVKGLAGAIVGMGNCICTD